MRKIFLSAIVGLSLSGQAFAQGPPSYGFGAAPCSTFLLDSHRQGDQARFLYYSWAQGFITAANALLSTEHAMVKNLMQKSAMKTNKNCWTTFAGLSPSRSFPGRSCNYWTRFEKQKVCRRFKMMFCERRSDA
jgi:hypothetical protein